MPSAPLRALTRAERKVLADLQLFSDDTGHVAISTRQLAETTGLSQSGIASILRRLADKRLIATCKRPRRMGCEYTVIHKPVLPGRERNSSPRVGRSSMGGRA
jgi:predicted transcriptional regulator